MSLKRLTNLALYTTLSLAVYAIESAFPMLIPIPGIKAGLANIITMILLRENSLRDASLVLTSRILLSALLFGQGMSLMYSGRVFQSPDSLLRQSPAEGSISFSDRCYRRTDSQSWAACCGIPAHIRSRRTGLPSLSCAQRHPGRMLYRTGSRLLPQVLVENR